MNAKAATQTGNGVDTAKLLIALVLIMGGVIGFYYYEEHSLLLRVLSLLVVTGISVAIAMQTERGRNTWGFVKDARTEVRKVVWPTRAETMQTTLIVIIMVLVVGIILWIMDTFLLWAVKLLTGQGG
ncbi:MAG: preprotein translocase subunit SecE [Gammaproteobacteria bacterium]|nr:preprotein translocase subunit SecE [Gammaproteobacteria bacterium]